MICPQCQQDVPVEAAQYGALYTCPKCSAVYFVNFEGEPEHGDTTLPQETSFENQSEVQPETAENFESLEPFQSLETSALEPSDADLEPNPFSSFPEMTEPLAINDPAESSVFSQVAEDIQNFGNQDEAVSNINYNLKVTGLDSREIVSLFEEALDDSKFGWIAKDILSGVKDGECHLKNLNPIQAFVLAKRIQFLDIEIEWTQNVETV